MTKTRLPTSDDVIRLRVYVNPNDQGHARVLVMMESQSARGGQRFAVLRASVTHTEADIVDADCSYATQLETEVMLCRDYQLTMTQVVRPARAATSIPYWKLAKQDVVDRITSIRSWFASGVRSSPDYWPDTMILLLESPTFGKPITSISPNWVPPKAGTQRSILCW